MFEITVEQLSRSDLEEVYDAAESILGGNYMVIEEDEDEGRITLETGAHEDEVDHLESFLRSFGFFVTVEAV